MFLRALSTLFLVSFIMVLLIGGSGSQTWAAGDDATTISFIVPNAATPDVGAGISAVKSGVTVEDFSSHRGPGAIGRRAEGKRAGGGRKRVGRCRPTLWITRVSGTRSLRTRILLPRLFERQELPGDQYEQKKRSEIETVWLPRYTAYARRRLYLRRTDGSGRCRKDDDRYRYRYAAADVFRSRFSR